LPKASFDAAELQRKFAESVLKAFNLAVELTERAPKTLTLICVEHHGHSRCTQRKG